MYKPAKPYKSQISNLIKQTWNTKLISVKNGIYPIIKVKTNRYQVDHTDGIGTKGFYHWKKGTFRNAVIDALAMNLNDLAMVRAVPFKLSDHITVPKEDRRIIKIVKALVDECKKRNIAIVGGENSFHNNMDGLDISMTVSGIVEDQNQSNEFKAGDVLIGFKSSGLHSNGFTRVRNIFGDEIRLEFIVPTAIYLDQILSLNKKFQINGMMHITGGAFTKLKDVLNNCNAVIKNDHKLKPPMIFKEIYSKGVTDEDMYKTFNCGVGFIISVSRESANKIVKSNKNTDIIGEVISGNGKVKIESAFGNNVLTF